MWEGTQKKEMSEQEKTSDETKFSSGFFSVDNYGDRLNWVEIDIEWAKNDISAKLGGGIKSLSLIHTDEFWNKFYEWEDNEGNKISYYKVGTSFLERQMRNPSGESDKVWQLALWWAIGQLDTKRDFYVELWGTYYKIPRNRIANPWDVLSAHIELVKRWITDHWVFFGSAGFGVSRIWWNNYTDGGFKISYSPEGNMAFVWECRTSDSDIPNWFYGQIGLQIKGIFSGGGTEVSPYFSFGHSIWSYCWAGLEYRIGLAEEDLQEKYIFEKSLKNTSVKAQDLIGNKIFDDNTAQTTTTQNNDNTQNQAPVWTQSVYHVWTFRDRNTADDTPINTPQTLLNLNDNVSDANGDTISFSIVSISVPDTIEQGEWNRAIQINNGVLQLVNLGNEDPDSNWTISIVVQARDWTTTENTTINFIFRNAG